jgi:hypothetical protein
MLDRSGHDSDVGRLQKRLAGLERVSRELFLDVLAQTCPRYAVLEFSDRAGRVRQLVAVQAWTDAALALADLELPGWTVRRLVHEDGEWWCTLSKQPLLPGWLDETVEARHDALPLAVLMAILEARLAEPRARETNMSSIPKVRPTSGGAVCCDNFA